MDMEKFICAALENHILQFTSQRETYRKMIQEIHPDDPAYDTMFQLIRDFDQYTTDQAQSLCLYREGRIR